MACRHNGHSLFCALMFETRQERWNSWPHDKVNTGAPNPRALRHMEQSLTMSTDGGGMDTICLLDSIRFENEGLIEEGSERIK